MFGNQSALPADTLFKFQNEQFIPDDIEHYERADLTVAAEIARKRAADDQQMKVRAEQVRKEYLSQREEMQALQDLPIGRPMKAPSPKASSRQNKLGEGITGQPSGSNLQAKARLIMSLSSVRLNGRKDNLSSELPPKLMTALALASIGMTFEDVATEVNMSSDALRKWRTHSDAQPFFEIAVSENFLLAKNLLLANLSE